MSNFYKNNLAMIEVFSFQLVPSDSMQIESRGSVQGARCLKAFI